MNGLMRAVESVSQVATDGIRARYPSGSHDWCEKLSGCASINLGGTAGLSLSHILIEARIWDSFYFQKEGIRMMRLDFRWRR